MIEENKDNIEESNELFEHYHFVADPGQALLRIDKWLMNRVENVTRNKIQNAAKSGLIRVNGKPVKSNYKVRPADDISVVMPEPPRDTEILPENIPLNIVYEDDDVIVINKPAGMVVHPAYANFDGTLVNALHYHFLQNNSKYPLPFLVHRIDKDTSGLIMAAKNEEAQSFLGRQFYDHSIERKYNALVWGVTENEGTIEGNVGRSEKDRRVMKVYPDGDFGKHAITHYKLLEDFGYVSLIECQLETGRTHQIRAHLKYIGHPLFADNAYGGYKIVKGTTFTKYKQFVNNCFALIPRQALHAKSLGFIHPNGEKMFFESDLADDMIAALDKWRKYAQVGMQLK